jgi:hypothetical protein
MRRTNAFNQPRPGERLGQGTWYRHGLANRGFYDLRKLRGVSGTQK